MNLAFAKRVMRDRLPQPVLDRVRRSRFGSRVVATEWNRRITAKVTSASELLFREHLGAATPWPRMLVLDPSPMGGGSATGQLLAAEFRGWPERSVLQFSSTDSTNLRVHRPSSTLENGAPATLAEARAEVEKFAPEVVFFRPDHRSAPLLELWDAIDDGTTHLALNIVDDWLFRLGQEDADKAKARHDEIVRLANRAQSGWAISGRMADDLTSRFGLSFDVISNVIDRDDWPTNVEPLTSPLTMNYAGWPASRKGGASLNQIALVASQMPKTDIKLNIRMPVTGPNEVYANAYSGLRNTEVGPWLFGPQYREYLSSAGVNLLTFNFDAITIGYLEHSFANRIPDLMTAGRPILVIGPQDLLSVDYLRGAGAVYVPEIEIEAIDEAVQSLVHDEAAREASAVQIRAESVRFDAATIRPRFHTKLIAHARSESVTGDLTTNPLEVVLAREN